MPRKKKQLDFDEVVRILRTNYNYAVIQKWIFKPLAWALYHTWKDIDEKEERREQDAD